MNRREFLSSTAASMKFRDNDAFLLILWLKETSSNGPRMNFHLGLYNGKIINEKKGRGRLSEDSSAILLQQDKSQRGEQGSRSEVSQWHSHTPVPPPSLNHGLQDGVKQDQSTICINALCKKLRLSIFGTRWITWVEKRRCSGSLC